MLKCFKTKEVYWGVVYEEGKEYVHGPIEERQYTLITNYEKYYEKIALISGSIKQIREGYTEDQLPSVIPGYMSHKDVKRLYTINVMIPMVSILGDDGHNNTYCILTREELIEKYGTSKFDSTVNLIEDNFYTKSDLRDNYLNKILK
jgi:hypothetical protein